MLTIKTEILIKKPPEAVYNWVLDLDNEKYRRWQPAHQAYQRDGERFYLEEEIEGRKLTIKGKLIAQVPYKELRFKGRISIMPRYLWMHFEEVPQGTRFIYEIGMGFTGPLGILSDFLLHKLHRWDATKEIYKKHMEEEWKALDSKK